MMSSVGACPDISDATPDRVTRENGRDVNSLLWVSRENSGSSSSP